jgi:hypothetical protein
MIPPEAGRPAERLQAIAGEGRFVGPEIVLDHPLVVAAGRVEIFPPLRKQAELVERTRGAGRLRCGLDHAGIVDRRRVWRLRCECLADEIGRVRGAGVVRIEPEQFAKPHAGGAWAPAAQLLQGGGVDLIRGGRRGHRGRRRPTVHRGRRRWCRGEFLAACLDLGLELGQPLLTLPGEGLHLHQLLLNADEVVGEVAPHPLNLVPQGPEPATDDIQRIQDALLAPDHEAQLLGARRVTAALLPAAEQQLILHPAQVALGGTASKGDQAQPRGR